MTDRRAVTDVVDCNGVLSLAPAKGCNAFVPIDQGGIDFMLHEDRGGSTGTGKFIGKVAVGRRWAIHRRFLGRDLRVALPVAGDGHAMAHDATAKSAEAKSTAQHRSWPVDGVLAAGRPSKALAAACAPSRFGAVTAAAAAGSAKRAADDEGAPAAPSLEDRITGSILAGAAGDALGAPLEFLNLRDIRAKYGPDGLKRYDLAYGRIGAVTDDTQMTMFTAEGLLRAFVRGRDKGICHIPSVVHHAYLRWLLTQHERPKKAGLEIGTDGWLYAMRDLHHRRAPGNTCISALRAAEGFGAPHLARNDSKGCGGVMRAAPVGLLAPVLGDDARLFELAAEIAALTHGHPSGSLSAGHLAVAIAALLRGESLFGAIEAADRQLAPQQGADELITTLAKAKALAASGRPTPEQIESLGGGWVGEEALAIAVCCALSARDLEDGLVLAANHSGDSDSTAAIAGNLLGALHGRRAIPDVLLEGLELRQELERLGADLATVSSGGHVGWDGYPGW